MSMSNDSHIIPGSDTHLALFILSGGDEEYPVDLRMPDVFRLQEPKVRWLNTPNAYISGKTPAECILVGDFKSVMEALNIEFRIGTKVTMEEVQRIAALTPEQKADEINGIIEKVTTHAHPAHVNELREELKLMFKTPDRYLRYPSFRDVGLPHSPLPYEG
jgi:hypothetical protein